MQNCCYTLAIRQITCQNGVSRTVDNVYTNISIGTVISLNFGYSITIVSISNSGISIQPEFATCNFKKILKKSQNIGIFLLTFFTFCVIILVGG